MDVQVVLSLKEAALWDEVKNRLHTSALRLSGGQQQRLCIARAIAVRPQVLLLDEPCSELDPISTRKIEELILTLKKKYAIVIVTHNMHQARRISDRIAFFHLGKLIEYESAKKLFSNPKQALTRHYVQGEFG
jgi:phosphate transport system ATP-binding protein